MPVATVPTLPSFAELESAAELVHRFVPPTPQYSWPLLNQRAGCEVWMKHENHTPVGAFKVRGGIVYMDSLRRGDPDSESTRLDSSHPVISDCVFFFAKKKRKR